MEPRVDQRLQPGAEMLSALLQGLTLTAVAAVSAVTVAAVVILGFGPAVDRGEAGQAGVTRVSSQG